MVDGTDLALLFEWQEYFDLEPFGEERADIRSAILGLKVCSALGASGLKIDDFMPNFGKKKSEPSKLNPLVAQAIFKERYGNNRKPRR